MDAISKNSPALLDALNVFSDDERKEFFRWSRDQDEFEGVHRRMLFGHPYYVLHVDDESSAAPPHIELIQPDHDRALNAYYSNAPYENRVFTHDMLFLRVPSNRQTPKYLVVAFPLRALAAFCSGKSDAEPLTPRELRTLAQLLSGCALRDAASEDGVSYETKRTQAKIIHAKLGYTRQTDMIADILTGLLLEIIAASDTPKTSSLVQTYVTRYAPRQTRLQKINGLQGHSFEIVDMGPLDGAPLVSMIPSTVGVVTDEFVDALYANNLRVLWPVRNGVLNPNDPLLGYAEHIDHAMAGIDAAREFLGSHTLSLHGAGTSAFLAIEYARRHPEHVQRIILQSAGSQSATQLFSSHKVTSAIGALAAKNPITLNLMFRFIDRKLNDPKFAKEMFARTFKNSPQDLEHVMAEFGPPDFGERLKFSVRHSFHAMVHDFRFITEPWWESAAQMSIPLHFIHGTLDGVTTIQEVQNLTTKFGHGTLHPIEGCGRMASYKHLVEITKTIAAVID